jgi:hypothetical protein
MKQKEFETNARSATVTISSLGDRSIFSILYSSIDNANRQIVCHYAYMYIVLHNLRQATYATQLTSHEQLASRLLHEQLASNGEQSHNFNENDVQNNNRNSQSSTRNRSESAPRNRSQSATRNGIQSRGRSTGVNGACVSRRSSGSSVERVQRRRNRVTDDEINELRSENNEIDQNFSLENMFEFAKNDRYPPKYLYFGSKKKKYSAVIHFFDHQTRFDSKPEKNTSLYFVCKLQNCRLSCNIGEFTILNKHLAKHESTLKWYNSYIQFSNKKKSCLYFLYYRRKA